MSVINVNMNREEWDEEILDEIQDEQQKVIEEKYGLDAAEKANYGWGIDDTEVGMSVATKVYAPQMVLVSTASFPSKDIAHSWRPYKPLA